jgi:hypothetical protein
MLLSGVIVKTGRSHPVCQRLTADVHGIIESVIIPHPYFELLANIQENCFLSKYFQSITSKIEK